MRLGWKEEPMSRLPILCRNSRSSEIHIQKLHRLEEPMIQLHHSRPLFLILLIAFAITPLLHAQQAATPPEVENEQTLGINKEPYLTVVSAVSDGGLLQ